MMHILITFSGLQAVSILTELSSAPLPLPSLLTSSQLTLLLSTALSPLPSANPAPSNDPSNQHWACQAISWMVMSLVHFGHVGSPVEGEGEEEQVERVGEKALPVKEEAVMVDREPEKEKGSADKPSSVSLQTDEWSFPQPPTLDLDMFGLLDDFNPMLQPFSSSFPIPPATFQIPPPLPIPTSETFAPAPFLPPHISIATAPPSIADLKSLFLSASPPPPPSLQLFPKPNHHYKLKKKLSKHHHIKSSKYAPGDYTEYPDPAPMSASKSPAVNPYRSFLISSCVDQRLRCSLDYPAELCLQNVAREQYEAVLRSVVTAQPSSGITPREEEEGKGERGLEDACDLVCESLDCLLSLARGPKPQVTLVSLLIFWSELNSLLFNKKAATPLQLGCQRRQNQMSLSSPKLLRALGECLSHTPSGHTPSRDATWQIGFSLLQQLCSSHAYLPLKPSQLSQLLLAFFTSTDELPNVGVARGVVSEFLKTVFELNLDVASGTGEEDVEEWKEDKENGEAGSGSDGIKGVHVILEVLVKILKERYAWCTKWTLSLPLSLSLSLLRPAVLSSPMFHTLVKVVNEESAIGSLFPPHPAPCCLAVSCVRHLLQMIPTMIRSSHLNAVCHSMCVCCTLPYMYYRYCTLCCCKPSPFIFSLYLAHNLSPHISLIQNSLLFH